MSETETPMRHFDEALARGRVISTPAFKAHECGIDSGRSSHRLATQLSLPVVS